MQKQAWTILFSIFFILFITGCGTLQSMTSKYEPTKPKDIDVTMDVQPVLSDDGTLQCNITTNLPNQTKLDVAINTTIYNTATTSVDNGKATAIFKYNKPGPYTVSIKTSAYPDYPDSLDQPNSVSDVIGYMGEKLKGPYVTSLGKYHGISFAKDITVGSKEQIAAAQAPAPALTEAEKELGKDLIIACDLNWDGRRKLIYNGITYEITRTLMPIDKRAGTGIRYEEVVSKIDFRLPLEKRVRTTIRSRIIN